MAMIDKLLIIGGGLIGSSIARAARGSVGTLVIADASAPARAALTRLEIADEVCDNGAEFADADLIILCVPPGQMRAASEGVVPKMKAGAILSDVGSYKQTVIKDIVDLVPPGVHFIPGHPIAGTEFSGPEAGFATLFQSRWCVLTPTEGTDEKAVETLKAFWEALGSDVAVMEPKRHDLVLATTSHVPHLIAYTLVGTATDMETVTNNEVVKYSAGGFRDFTRIAASDPAMWRDVMMGNRDGVLEVVDRFIEDLSALKRAIRWGDEAAIMAHFEKASDIRVKVLDAGQDAPALRRINKRDGD
jgi:cyclohexadieny/prephenate dehydrogenase